MSDVQYVQLEPRKPNIWHMYRAMVGIGVVCGFIIVSVFQLTAPAIKENQRALLEKSLYQIFPTATVFARYQLQPDGQFTRIEEPKIHNVVYAMYDTNKQLVGIVIRAKGMGYQDAIEMLYGYNPVQQAIEGYTILDSRETPGLGAKIETDPDFKTNFAHLDVTLDTRGDALAHPIELVKSGHKTQPWQIDTITGATISSTAVGNMVAQSAAQWIPTLQQRLQDFEP
ncbi:MAG: FMN-binding protein [Gammaproteobacteria bacterium]|jgi:electron transport complex protein RnfG